MTGEAIYSRFSGFFKQRLTAAEFIADKQIAGRIKLNARTLLTELEKRKGHNYIPLCKFIQENRLAIEVLLPSEKSGHKKIRENLIIMMDSIEAQLKGRKFIFRCPRNYWQELCKAFAKSDVKFIWLSEDKVTKEFLGCVFE